MKATAIAPSNIAFIKYWGKKDEALRIPFNASFSMNCSALTTTATVSFDSAYENDEITLEGETLSEKEKQRITRFLDRIREKAEVKTRAKVVAKNSFPKGIGAASSASGFAALAVAATNALGLLLSEKELTILARIGSGSACRSIPDGFVMWETGERSEDSFAYSLYPHTYWGLRDIFVIVSSEEKKVGSTDGMAGVATSPLWESWVAGIPGKIQALKHAFAEKNFSRLGEIIEEDSKNMHLIMGTQNPPLQYQTRETIQILEIVKAWRIKGIPVYTTVDAGPNVHLICEGKSEQIVLSLAQKLPHKEKIIVSAPAPGAHIISSHLF